MHENMAGDWEGLWDDPTELLWEYQDGALWARQSFRANEYLGDIAGIFRYTEDLSDFNTPGILFLQHKYLIDARDYPHSLAYMEWDLHGQANCAVCVDTFTGRLGMVTTHPIQKGERLAYWN